MSGLMAFDWWSISFVNQLTSHMLANRGLSHEQIRWELNKNIYQTAQPLSTSAKAIHLIGGSSFEQAQFLFLSDVMNKFGLVMMQGKRMFLSGRLFREPFVFILLPLLLMVSSTAWLQVCLAIKTKRTTS